MRWTREVRARKLPDESVEECAIMLVGRAYDYSVQGGKLSFVKVETYLIVQEKSGMRSNGGLNQLLSIHYLVGYPKVQYLTILCLQVP